LSGLKLTGQLYAIRVRGKEEAGISLRTDKEHYESI